MLVFIRTFKEDLPYMATNVGTQDEEKNNTVTL
jgi:hypothetical protein